MFDEATLSTTPLGARSTRNLFLAEALAARTTELGVPWKATGPTYLLIACFFFCLLTAIGCFSYFYKHPEVTTVGGRIWPVAGVEELVSPRPGVVKEYFVSLGQRVRPGDAVARVSFDSGSRDTTSVLQTQLALADKRNTARTSEMESKYLVAAQRIDTIQAELRSAQSAVKVAEEYVRTQERLVLSRESVSRSIEEAARLGSISAVQAEQARSEWLAEKRQLSSARLTLLNTADRLARLNQEVKIAESELIAADARLDDHQAASTEQRLAIVSAQDVTISTHTDGVVAAIPAAQGVFIPSGGQIAQILPSDAKLQVELWIPSQAIGMLRAGTPVRVKVDSFPHTRHGVLTGKLSSLSSAPLMLPAGNAHETISAPHYQGLVQIDLKDADQPSFIKQLKPGMTVQADVELQKRRLLHFVTDPFNIRG